jgi:phosphoglycolate phosphatase
MKKLVIFDLDGTLLNTIADLGHGANYALKQCGFPTHDIASYPLFVGNGVGRLLERVLPPDAHDTQTVARVRAVFEQYYDRHLYDYTCPYPGIPQLLHDLAAQGLKFAVTSNKYQSATSRLVAHFFPHLPWEAVHGMREGVPAKPDPSIVFNVLAGVPTPKNDVMYVGDSGVDMETARRACVESVGVTWGFRPLSELRQFHAEHIANDPSDVYNFVMNPSISEIEE